MIGTTVANRYRILSRLGAGGMATVYRVYDERLEREVALKLLAPRAPEAGQPLKRFIREFQAATKLRHPHVIELYDIEALPDGGHFYTMELLGGSTLEDLLFSDEAMSPAQAVQITRQIAGALDLLHETGIVHRDLKPSNIIFADDGRAVLADFGLALNLNMTGITETGTMVGTPVYMSPEQLIGGHVDGRSDIYQLGVIFYQMVCGELPFGMQPLPALITSIIHDDVEALHLRQPIVDEAWSAFAYRCMAKDPAERYTDAIALTEALELLPLPADGAGGVDSQEQRVSGRKGAGARAGEGGAGSGSTAGGSRPTGGSRSAGGSRLAGAGQRDTTLLRTYSALKSGLSGPVRIGALIVFVLLFLGMAVVFRPRRTFDVHSFQAEAGPECVTLKWSSSQPYPSQVELTSADGKKLLHTGRDGNKATKEHQVFIANLQPGRNYSAVVLYPNGRSLPKTIKVSSLKVTLLEISVDNSGLQAALHFPSCRALRLFNQKKSWQATYDKASLWRIFALTDRLADLQLEGELEDGRKRRFALTDLLLARAKHLNNALSKKSARQLFSEIANFMGRDFVEKMDRRDKDWKRKKPGEMLEAINRGRNERHRAAVSKFLRPLNLSHHLTSTRKLSPLVFDTPNLPFELRSELYSNIQEVARLFVYFDKWNVEGLMFPKELPDQGIFALADTPMRYGNSRSTLWSTKNKHIFLGMCVPAICPEEQRTEWQTSFEMKNVAKLNLAAIELTCPSFDSFGLRLFVNQKHEFYICDRPIFSHPDKSTVLLRQHIPADCFREGANSLEVKIEWLFDDLTNNSVIIKQILLVKNYRQ